MSAPSSSSQRRAKPNAPEPPTPLRLVAFRGGLGIELYESIGVGPLRIEELTWSLPGVTFPLELGGGVRSFRHRRGLLQRLVVSIGLSELEQWLTKRLDQQAEFGALLRPVAVWPLPEGLGLGVFGERGVIAADLLWLPQDGDGGFVVSHPRGVLDTPQPPLTSALMLVSRALGELQTHTGRVVRLTDFARNLVRAVLPGLGFRLPAVGGVRCGGFEFRSDRIVIAVDRGFPVWAMPAPVTRAREFAAVALGGDTALLAGDWSSARRAYVAALEQAPRHPELSQTIAAIDAHFEERAEAALGMLVESLPAVEFGLVGAQLLAKTGDTEGARLAVSKLAGHERFPPLCAAYWVKLSEWLPSSIEKAEVIELALACSAASVVARWARFRSRVEVGDVNGAVADAEHLEASARGADAKHTALLQAAQELSNVGFVDAAAKLYERALRYSPSDPRSSLGVALGLIEAGKYERATVVLQRTLDLATTDEGVASETNLALGRLLAEHAGDLPAAIARVRRVTGLGRASVEARGFEAQWRGQIGDVAGATLAFARLGETIAASPEVTAHRAGHWLLQAGKYSLEQLGDPAAAERFLATALRRMPKDPTIADTYRLAASRVAQPRLTGTRGTAEPSRAINEDVVSRDQDELASDAVAVGGGAPGGFSVTAARSAESLAALPLEEPSEPTHSTPNRPDEELEEEFDEVLLERRVDSLKAQLLANAQAPDAVIYALVDALGRLERLEEAYALLRAQYDDSSGDTQARLGKALADVLARLVAWSRARGNEQDAELYELTLAALHSV